MITARSMSTARRRLARTACVLVAVVVAGAASPAAQARPPKGQTARVSEGFKGEQLDGASTALGLSADGRSALFSSAATNLLPSEGTPNAVEVYVRDLRNGHIERVSVADDGSKLDAATSDASISADGRYVAFSTTATDVVPGQAKHASDVFVRDRWTGRTELITAGTLATTDDESIRSADNPTLSADGRYVAYASNRTDLATGIHRGKINIYVTDRWTRTTRLVTASTDGTGADNHSYRPTISADGRTVGFVSRASNLAPQAPGATTEAELAGPRFYPYYVWSAADGRIVEASVDETGAQRGVGLTDARISPDGRFALYGLPTYGVGPRPGSHGIRMDVYAHELATGRVTVVNTSLPGTTTTEGSYDPVMTADGRWIYFDTTAENIVPGDTNQASDVFRREVATGRIERVSLTPDGGQATAGSDQPYVDATGGTVLFDAVGGTLVPGEDNTLTNVFRRVL
ncbi:PD40 domain-containing protein [Streptomyces sp. NRRL WC-3742]|uniref:PD40 domain-containing protein n=1 Tax=Streptomyces sp. NRRL WC-3742 TaxID=1463934 RepID=UPI00068B93EE|nr:PD40 domain-containing protein [Streptomyces sp. NRRL WC-3742]